MLSRDSATACPDSESQAFECLQYMVTNGCRWTTFVTCEWAARAGFLSCLRFVAFFFFVFILWLMSITNLF